MNAADNKQRELLLGVVMVFCLSFGIFNCKSFPGENLDNT